MAQVTVKVTDIAEIRAYQCRIPDDVPSSRVAARLARLLHFPVVGPDNFPLDYGFVRKGGSMLERDAALAESGVPESAELRLVPEFVAAHDNPEYSTETAGLDQELSAEIVIGEEMALLHDVGLELRPDVRIDACTHREIEDFSRDDTYKECAGLLLGSVSAEDESRVLHIKGAAPALGAVGTRSSVRVTLEAWECVLSVRDTDYADLRVLGWFHTHPGWGVFMSDLDVFIHRHFFPHPNMVAYVLDPTTVRDGFFYWYQGKLGLSPNYGLVGTAEQVMGQTQKHRAAKRRPDLRDGIIAVLAASTVYFGFIRGPVISQVAVETPPAQPTAKAPATPGAKPGTQSGTKPESAAQVKPQPGADSEAPRDRMYHIQRRENLWIICSRVYGDGELAGALAAYNGISDLTSLRIGQEIKLPPKEVLTNNQ